MYKSLTNFRTTSSKASNQLKFEKLHTRNEILSANASEDNESDRIETLCTRRLRYVREEKQERFQLYIYLNFISNIIVYL